MKKIIDQYTDRTDLSASQKFKLRHPDRIKAYQRAYALNHLEEHRAYEANRRWKLRAEKIKKVVAYNASMIVRGRGPIGGFKTREILRLHARGKDVADIAIWTNSPVSAVLKVIETSKQTKQELQPSTA